jgi:predicted PurR-regulated permease PerM
VNNTRLFLALIVVIALGFLLYELAPILTPFLLSVLLAYIGNPTVRRLQIWRVPRPLTIVVMFLVFLVAVLALMLVLVPLIQRQILILVDGFPAYVDWLQRHVSEWTAGRMPIETEALKQQLLEQWQNVGKWAATALSFATTGGLRLVGWLLNIVLVPVITFYLLRDWDEIWRALGQTLPLHMRPRVIPIAHETDMALASFLRGQLLVMLSLAAIYSLGLWFVGLDVALLIGLVAGLISFIPYLGFITGILAASLAAVFQFHDTVHVLWVLGVFMFGQTLESTVLTPRLVGERLGLHPVVVIFAVMAGGQLFGFFGILLALPVAAMLNVWIRHLYRGYQAHTVVAPPL